MSRFFHILFVACSLAVSCSGEGLTVPSGVPDPETDGARTLLTVKFELPQEEMTRVPVGDLPQQPGSAEENRISSAWIVLGEISKGASSPLTIHSVHRLTDLQMVGNNSQWQGTITVKAGYYRVFVIANPPASEDLIQAEPGADWSQFVNQSISFFQKDYAEVRNLWRDNHFLMTNAFHNTISEHDVNIESGKENHTTIRVQRVCARFDYHPRYSNNTYTLQVIHKGRFVAMDVRLTHVGLMNVSNSFYLLKQISPDETGHTIAPHEHETDKNYVADADWVAKRMFYYGIFDDSRLPELFFFSSEASSALEYHPLPEGMMADDEYSRICYTTENTIPGVNKQVNKLSTGLVFKGWFRPTEVAADAIYFFQRDNDHKYLFADYAGLYEFLLKEGISLPATPDEASDALLAQKGVRKFTRAADGSFPVWYTYWNRHNDNHLPMEMGVMEFATVRNNIYRLRVNKISTLGLPKDPVDPLNPWKPDGNTPDELGMEMDVTMKVSAWVERVFEHEI